MPAHSPAPSKQLLQLSVMPAHSPVPLKQATIALSHASSQSSNTQTSKYSSQLCQLIVQHHSNKKLQLSVMPAHSPALSKQANIALSYGSSQSSTTQTSNHSSQLCQLIVHHHPNKQLKLSVMPAHSPAPPKQATIALSYASPYSSTTQTSNHSSQLCQLIVQHHPNKQPKLSVLQARNPAHNKQVTIAVSYASSQSTTIQTSNYSSQLCQFVVQNHQTSNHSSQVCQRIVQHHPNKQLQLSVMPAHSPAPSKQATKALSYASSQSSTTQTSNHSSQLGQLIVQHHQKHATIALSYASSQSSTTQTSNYSSQLCQLIVKHHPNKQLQVSVMPAHSPAPPKQATIALSYASSQSSTTQSSNHSSQNASSQSSTTQRRNYSPQLCQLIVQHHSNKQLQLSVMPAHSPAPPKQATIALSYASSQSSTTQTSNYRSQLCQLIVQHHPNKQLQLSVMPAHSPAPPNQATIALRMPAHSPAPPKEGTIALSYASSQSSTTQTSNYSSQSCQLIVQYHPIKQPQLSVVPAHSPAPPQKVTIALSYACSQTSTTQTSNYIAQLCQLIVQHHPNSKYSSQLCQLIVQHHPNKQLQVSVMPAHSPPPSKQATIALSYACSQSSTTQTSNYSSQL